MTCKSGVQRTVEITRIVLGEELLVMLTDITERKRAEKEKPFSIEGLAAKIREALESDPE